LLPVVTWTPGLQLMPKSKSGEALIWKGSGVLEDSKIK
jgi:hypothetical protein